MQNRQFSSKRQRQTPYRHLGFLSIEISIALIIAGVIGYFTLMNTLKKSAISSAYIQADQLKLIRDGLESYAQINGASIVQGSAISGVSNTLQPTVPELIALGMLPVQTGSVATLNNSPFVLRLSVSPTGCTLGNCVISGYAYIRDPFLRPGDVASTGRYNGTTVGAILDRLGGDSFARVTPNGNLVSASGGFSYANSTALFAHPTITVGGQPYPAGIVGMRISAVTPPNPSSGSGSGSSGTGSGSSAPCPAGTIDGVQAAGTNGAGKGNQCTFNYPDIPVGSSATVANSQSSTLGSITLRCISINGNSTLDIQSVVCTKK